MRPQSRTRLVSLAIAGPCGRTTSSPYPGIIAGISLLFDDVSLFMLGIAMKRELLHWYRLTWLDYREVRDA